MSANLSPEHQREIVASLTLVGAYLLNPEQEFRCPRCGAELYHERSAVRTVIRCSRSSCTFRVAINTRGEP